MVIEIKNTKKLFILSIMSCCAVFICTLFLNYNLDLLSIKDKIISEQMKIFYNAQISTSKIVCIVSGCCIFMTTVIMMIFYIKHYIDIHKKELGILKALGYSRIKIAINFWFFGISILIGTTIGFIGAFVLMPKFYEVQNNDGILPEITMNFHSILLLFLVIFPTVLFVSVAIIYSYLKLKLPVLSLIKDNYKHKVKSEKHIKNKSTNILFLEDLRKITVKKRKSLIFFIIFSSFCYSAMTQMSFSMKDLSSLMMGIMMLIIGLILAFVTIFLALTTVVNANTKTIAMMKAFGYSQNDCQKAILNGYRPLSYIGFIIGTVYQYFLLRIMVNIVFKSVENIPEYKFDVIAMLISFATFVLIYETIIFFYTTRIKKVPIKNIMIE